MTSEKIIFTYEVTQYHKEKFSQNKIIASMSAILDKADGSKAVALISFLGVDYFMVVVGADDKIRTEMEKAGLKPIHETEVRQGKTAALLPVGWSNENPVPDTWVPKNGS